MGGLSVTHMVILLVIVVLLFGAGKIPRLMGDVAKGIKSFKAGMKDGDDEVSATPPAEAKALRAEEAPVHKDKSNVG